MATFSTTLGETITGNTSPSELQKPDNASLALEEIQTENFYNTLKSYYSYREQDTSFDSMAHADLLDYFYTDQSWKNHNTISMGMDMANIMGEDDEERVKQFAYISQTYASLPSFWNDPNRNFGSWLIDNGGAMVLDPVNLIGYGIGGQYAKQAYKAALRLALKEKMAKEISQITIKEAAKEAEQLLLGKAIKKGALTEGYINAGIAGGQDILLQNTAIEAGIQDEFSLKQSGIATAAGFGFGTVFGAGFTAGAFKLKTRSLTKTSIKNLDDIHKYGKSTTTGSKLFDDLTVTKSSSKADVNAPKNEKPPKTTKEYIKKLRSDKIRPDDKPPKLAINATKLKDGGYTAFVKNKIAEITEQLEKKTISKEQMIEDAVALGQDRIKFRKMANDMANQEQFVKMYATVVGQADDIRSTFDKIGALSTQLNRLDLANNEVDDILNEIARLDMTLDFSIKRKKKGAENIARGQVAHQIDAKGNRAAELLNEPEDASLLLKKKGTKEQQIEFWRTVGKLGDREQIIAAMQDVKKIDRWDLMAEYVNNNLLSSPDTHILNIVSGMTQTVWKPVTMLLRGANMLPTDSARARQIMREALHTFVYQFAYTGHALKRAGKSFYEGRPILDSTQMKYDSNIRQGQLQRFISEFGKTYTDRLGMTGKVMQKGQSLVGKTITFPMRILAAGDEFLKSMMFKARMTAAINSRIIDESPDFSILKGDGFRKRYKDMAKEMQSEFMDVETGRAKEIGNTVEDRLNAPLHYAREGSYTQPASQTNPLTNNLEGGLTGWILSQTAGKAKWTRALGLHFINTPSNLLRWNFQHLPMFGRYQFQMRHLLAEADLPDLDAGASTFKKITHGLSKGKLGRITAPIRGVFGKSRYLNPEAAAEANARIQMGYLIWTGAFSLVMAGKITGGGDRDWRVNKSKEVNTGWQPYSWKTNDGRYISLNRLDPIFTPMFIMADMMEVINNWSQETDDLPPSVDKKLTEMSMGLVTMLTRNLTSKFYTKNIIELFNFMSSDDFMKSRGAEKEAGSQFAQFAFKLAPMSGGLRYASRISDNWEREMWTFMDRISTLNPSNVSDATMPKRNMFGQTINRKRGWLFGLGGETGLWSTPFAMTTFKNNATAKFLQDKKFNYLPPSKIDRYSGFDLKNLRNSNNQTAYDRWLELKNDVYLDKNGKAIKKPNQFQGTKYTVQEYIEYAIATPTSKLYRYPEGLVVGKNYQVQYIVDVIHAVEKVAYINMIKEFPEIMDRFKLQNQFIKEQFNNQKSVLNELLN